MTKRKDKSEIAPPSYSSAKRIFYVKCPFCGMTKPLKKYEQGLASFGKSDLSELDFISIREGGGWKSGFKKVAEIKFIEAMNDEEYLKLIMDIKNQCDRILNLIKNGGNDSN